MGTVIVYIVALDQHFVPAPAAAQAALALAPNYSYSEPELVQYDDVSFIGGGDEFGPIECDHCGFDLLEALEWTKAMSKAYGEVPPFGDLEFRCASCAGPLSLLDYSLRSKDHAFGRFAVMWCKTAPDQVNPEVVARFAQALGIDVRALEVHI